jgi:hypothetical protein
MMKPFKIEISTVEKFKQDVSNAFPSVDMDLHDEAFSATFNEYKGKYSVVVFDLITGQMLHALSRNGWIMSHFYVESIPLIDAITEDYLHSGMEYRDEIKKEEPTKKATTLSPERIDAILDKISIHGEAGLNPNELNFLREYSDMLRKSESKK